MQKKKKWMKLRHRIITELARPFLHLAAVLKYHIKVDRFTEQGPRNWLVLSNHQTDFDQFFIGMAFRKPIYYVAMEDVFSNGFISKLLSWAVAPIPIMKASSDVRAVMNCIRLAREGGTVALFPEGNRTYSGRTCYIKPGVAGLAKKMGLPIAIFRIEGGYGVKPRWADKTRHGKMKAGVRRVIEPEEYQNMSNSELYQLICKELWVDETEDTGLYQSSQTAEHLERVLYVCPDCGLSEFDSEGTILHCKHCGNRWSYGSNKQLTSLNTSTTFRFVADWYDYQENFIRSLDLSPYENTALYSEHADILEVIVYDRKQLLKKDASLCLYGNRLEVDMDRKMILDFSDIKAMACIAGHKLNVFYQDKIYQFKGDIHFNALKYCNIYYHAKFIKEGQTDGKFQFLGL